jgi:acyl-coenzyme A thioesterase PaaI-like protein
VDIAAAMAARTSDPAASGAITVSLTTNFLMGATGTLRAHAVAANPGRSLVTVNVDVRDEKDCAVATAMAVMKLKRGGPADPEETRR